jgi:segregation and condensation protein A
VAGEVLAKLPDDLYIPPDALEIFLEAFEGPLDLLLYLIKRQNLDICNIPIAEITRQYIEYVELMQELRLELAAEYLVMAATLAEIKSRLLLPRPKAADDDEGEDPRAELIRRLQQYERFKQAAEDIDALPRFDRDLFPVTANPPDFKSERPLPDIELAQLLGAMRSVMQRSALHESHKVDREILSLRERMSQVLELLQEHGVVEFEALFGYDEGRDGVVVAFMAILELSKQDLVQITQTEAYGPIHIRPHVGSVGQDEG